MSLLSQVIRERRTIRDFKPDTVDESIVIGLLDDAVWAPFHSKEEPWRFIFVNRDANDRFYQAVASSFMRQDYYKNMAPEQLEQLAEKLRAMFHAVPAFLIVTMKESEGRKRWEEDFAATSALIQNFMLLAWEQGIGTVWKTNAFIYDREFCNDVGVHGDEKIVGIIQIGYPNEEPDTRGRGPASDRFSVF